MCEIKIPYYVLENTEAATGVVLQKKLFLKISQNSQACNLIKKILWHRCLPVKGYDEYSTKLAKLFKLTDTYF